MKLVDEVRTFHVELEETLGYDTIGQVIDGYSNSLRQIGFDLKSFRELENRPVYELVFKKIYDQGL